MKLSNEDIATLREYKVFLENKDLANYQEAKKLNETLNLIANALKQLGLKDGKPTQIETTVKTVNLEFPKGLIATYKGDKGEPGEPGKTPTKNELLTLIKPLIPSAPNIDEVANMVLADVMSQLLRLGVGGV